MMLILALLASAARGGSLADQAQYGLAHGFAALVAVAALSLVAGLFGHAPV